MKRLGLAVLSILLLAAQASAADKTVFKTEKDKVSYGIGVSVAKNFQQQGLDVNAKLVVKGLQDALAGKKLLMSDNELRQTMMAFQTQLRQKQMEARKTAAIDNKKAGEDFLAANQKKAGVVTLPNGLQYKILKAGAGQKPTAEDTVEVRYRGTLINGKEFDSSGKETRSFKLGQVIPGWREALPLMPVGSKWQLFVPSDLAYGERGMGQAIMPNTVLIFEVELVGLKPAGNVAPK